MREIPGVTDAIWSHLILQSKMDVIPILVIRHCVRIGVAWSGLVCKIHGGGQMT